MVPSPRSAAPLQKAGVSAHMTGPPLSHTAQVSPGHPPSPASVPSRLHVSEFGSLQLSNRKSAAPNPDPVKMGATMLQTGGFILGVIGTAAVIAATGMNNWSSQDRQGDVVTSVYVYKGLWKSCEVATSGFTECRPFFTIIGLPAMDMWSIQDRSFKLVTSTYTYSGLWHSCVGSTYGTTECRPFFTILGLPASFQATRALMIVGIVMGSISILISICSLKCIRIGSTEDGTKANMTLACGIMFIIAGLCGIAGASVFANQIVSSFRMTTYNSEYGGGIGGMGMGGIGGTLTPSFNAVAYKAPAHDKPVYDHSDGGRHDNQKYV
ncbi:hypothetical protein SKAU_G00202070 [Synaphobranchus kaupii]|uniref:Claudin n=1 Tax=Synaphobranchus kaupii TaxID=118154 RepID=A0A9Q1IYB1_SYNKA|nr:hypothetical protein SKAU_G00202070 [Synaphobranchus kaupii]